MTRAVKRKLVDKQGNTWCLDIPTDVNADSTEDILLAATEGIVKLVGYRLASEAEYKLPADNSPILNGGKTFSFYHTVEIGPSVTQEEFSTIMEGLLKQARESRINRVRLTEFEGKPALQDSRGYYVKASSSCHICGKDIEGTRRLSIADGVFTRAQMFIPNDPKVVPYRPGSRHRVCSDCAPKSVKDETVALPFTPSSIASERLSGALGLKSEPPTPPQKATEEIKPEIPPAVTQDPVMQELLELSKPGSDIDPVFLKGIVYGIMKSRMK